MSAVAILAAIAMGGIQQVDIQSQELTRPEGPRQFLLATPMPKVDHRIPLVILLHGHGGNARQLLGQGLGAAPLSLWLEIAASDDVMLIVPDGARGNDDRQGWNDCRADAASNPRTDDVGFIAALIDRAVAGNNVDPRRVYVMGMSNGGMMTFRLAAEIPGRLAAVATVGASMAAKSQCNPPSKKISVLMISGDADPLVPYTGGEVSFFSQKTRGTVMGVEDAARTWRLLDGLPENAAETRVFPKLDLNDTTRADLRLWGGDPKRFQVELIRITGGGHIEPSIRLRIGALHRRVVGTQNGDFEAAEEAWKFFQSKSR